MQDYRKTHHPFIWQLGVAVVLSFAGIILLFMGFWCSPAGEIHNSVLVGFGEISTFAGALFGVDYSYKYKFRKQEYPPMGHGLPLSSRPYRQTTHISNHQETGHLPQPLFFERQPAAAQHRQQLAKKEQPFIRQERKTANSGHRMEMGRRDYPHSRRNHKTLQKISQQRLKFSNLHIQKISTI